MRDPDRRHHEPVPQPEVVRFARHEIETDIAGPQVMVAGRFLGGAWADLAVVHGPANGERLARVLSFDGSGWTVAHEHRLGHGVRWVDRLSVDGRDWLDLASGATGSLAEVSSVFAPPGRDDPLHVDITHDITGNGLDDLVLPVQAGFSVITQHAGGQFADPVRVDTAVRMDRIYGSDGARFDPWSESGVHRMDHDRDDTLDLATWRGDHFVVYQVRDSVNVDPTPRRLPLTPAFDADHLSWITEGDLTGYVLRAVADLNGDARADLVGYRLDGASRRSAIEVYLGVDGSRGNLIWSATPEVVLPSQERLHLDLSTVTLDAAERPELLATTLDDRVFQSGLWRRMKGAMGDDLWLHLEFRRFDTEGNGTPATIERLALDGSPSHREPMWIPLVQALRGGRHQIRQEDSPYPRAFNRTNLLGDVTGDGRADLILEWTHERFGLYRGVPGPVPFADEPQEVVVPLPHDGEFSWLARIDDNDTPDLVLHHTRWSKDIHGGPTEPPDTEPHRIIILLAQ